MDLYFNDQKVSKMKVSPETTVAQIKKSVRDWLSPQGYADYNIRLRFNNGTELSPVVFDTSVYDNVNFQAKSDLIKGGSIYVTAKTVLPKKDSCLGKEVHVLIHIPRRDIFPTDVRVFSNLGAALKYYVGNSDNDEWDVKDSLFI